MLANVMSQADLKELQWAKEGRYQGEWLYQRGRYQLAVSLTKRALAVEEEFLGSEHAETAATRNSLASMYVGLGQYSRALPLFQKSLAINEKILGSEHAETATSISSLAELYSALGQYDKAMPLFQRALGIREKVRGPEHDDTVESLNKLAQLYRDMGKYNQALPLFQRALAIQEKSSAPKDVDIAVILNNLAALYNAIGQYDKALSLYQRTLSISEQVLGSEHANTALTLSNLASVYQVLGQYDKALPLYQRALAINEKAFDPEHEAIASSLNNLALLYVNLGQYDNALPLYQRALTVAEKVLGPEHAATAISLNNLAWLYQTLGQYEKALLLYRRALAIREKAFGPEQADTATILDNLALLYVDRGQYDVALPFYQRALAIYEKAFGSEHEAIANGLNNLALLYVDLGEYDKALPMYQRALAILEKTFGSEHASTASILDNQGELYSALGQFNKALPLYQRALAVREKVFWAEHSDIAKSLQNLAFFHGEQHQSHDALHFFLRGRDVSNRVIARSFPILGEQEKLVFVKKSERGYYGSLSLIQRQLPNDAAAVRAGLDTILSRKAIVFDAQARQQEAIAKSLDPETKKLWNELTSQRVILAKQMQSGAGNLMPEEYQSHLKALQDAISKLESRLAAKSALVAQNLKQRNVTSKEVARVLGEDSVLVEYAKIQDYDWDKKQWTNIWRYLAFVLKGDGSVMLVDLGEASSLDQEIARFLRMVNGQLESSFARQQEATHQLYQRLWHPLVAVVGNTFNVIISPDGMLNLVPFAALQDEKGRYLIEEKKISYITSGRDLTKDAIGIKPSYELFLAAAPQFERFPSYSLMVGSDKPSQTVVRSAGFNMQFTPLPGTSREATQIPPYLGGRKIVRIGNEATEDSVLNALHPRILHLATHGFFLADQPVWAKEPSGVFRAQGGRKVIAIRPNSYENSLLRSGLAFAGANHAAEVKDGRDGLLTALEVSGMDLHGTDLVTLSACETGRGEIITGEGVFGLRRAFALAGASHLMMSLWRVSDKVTAQQMTRFYQLYGKGVEPAAALREAQLSTIAELRGRGVEYPPALWAPFIMQGR